MFLLVGENQPIVKFPSHLYSWDIGQVREVNDIYNLTIIFPCQIVDTSPKIKRIQKGRIPSVNVAIEFIDNFTSVIHFKNYYSIL